MASSIEKTGDWGRVGNVISNLTKEMKSAQVLCLRRWGLKAEGIAKQHISSQDLGWKALQPSTKAFKARMGYSDNILVMTSTYFQSISSEVVGSKVYAGVKRGVRENGGAEVDSVARVHEYGNAGRGIPARPLWGPTYEETMEWTYTNNSPVTYFMDAIKKY